MGLNPNKFFQIFIMEEFLNFLTEFKYAVIQQIYKIENVLTREAASQHEINNKDINMALFRKETQLNEKLLGQVLSSIERRNIERT